MKFDFQIRKIDPEEAQGQTGEAGGDIKWCLKTPAANPRPPDLNFTSTGSAFGPFRSHFHLTLRTTEPPDLTHKSHGGAGGRS